MTNVQTLTSKQVKDEITRLMEVIQGYDGSSGYAETEWRKDQQDLIKLLSEYPFELHRLSDEVKAKIEAIVKGYLEWSFNAYW